MKEIKIHEVGLRDGLQMESESVPTSIKIKWIEELAGTGVDIIQLGSFVHPVKVPQMADTDDLFKYFSSSEHSNKVIFSGLLLNEKGLERAFNCGVSLFCMGVSASETHSKKNTGMGVAEATERIINMAKIVMQSGKKVQLSVQSAFGCGFEGDISEEVVFEIIAKYLDAGIKNISLADTAGHANPLKVESMFKHIKSMDDTIELACHFHNTYGMGLANCYAAINTGVKYFESAFGGLGGCPFTKLAAGNVCTEDFVHFLQNMGMRNDIDIFKLISVTKQGSEFFKKELPGFIYKSGPIKH